MFKKENKEMPSMRCPLEVDSLLGTALETNQLRNISDEIKKISNNIDRWSTGFRKLQVTIAEPPKEYNEEED